MAAAPLNPHFAPAVRYAKVPLVGSVVGEAPSLDGCLFRWAVGGDALATPPANGVVLLETPDLTRPFDSKQFGFVVRAGDDGSEERLRDKQLARNAVAIQGAPGVEHRICTFRRFSLLLS